MSVYRPKGNPYYHYDFQINGNRFHGSTKAGSRREAIVIERELKEKAREEIKRRAKSGQVPMTFNEAAGRYWKEHGKFLKSARKHFASIQRLVDYFGTEKRLDEIDDAAIAGLVAYRRQQPRWEKVKLKSGDNRPVTSGTVNREVLCVLKTIFRRASILWLCHLPLAPHWKEHWLKEPKERVREIREHERTALDAAMRPDYVPWYEFLNISARRLAETLIRWNDIDWDAGVITTSGKGDSVVRTPLTPAIRALIEPQKGRHPVYVFTYVAQRNLPKKHIVKGHRYPITVSNAQTTWRRCRAKAGVKNIRLHDHRHDRATKLLRETHNLKLVQLALNHANISTTTKYAHVMDEDLAAALEESAKSRNLSRSDPRPNC
ncbi:phage integrase family protein [Rhizobium leguminosarum]|uniref:tyrosine-type recombinase/integrase n=1 Tax=Rhizobium leguminosarum TaxID=384 RepID=UPI001C9763B7|nr:tyrosine-type recombinase/integrase [Rhizobium leguminosarum]MBY5363588.1 phage integrase family protein [Rhizobium leguminosarum]